MCFHFCFCLFSWYSNGNCKFYNRFKSFVITAGTKKYNSIIKNKRKKHNKIVLLAKSQLNRTEVLIHKALLDSNISHDEFVLMNNVLKEFFDTKEKIKNSNK